MKKQFLLFVMATLVSASSLMAQADARVRQTPEEKAKTTMEKLAAFDLNADIRTQAEGIFIDFYKNQQAAMQEARTTGGDRTVMMEKRKQLAVERDSKLKQILTADQYNKWISDIEPTLRSQRSAAPAPAKTAAPAPASSPN